MKKIKLIIYHPYSYIGGADNSLKRLLQNLDHKKFSITFISLKKSVLEKNLKDKIQFINLGSKRAILSIFRLRNIIKKIEASKKFSKVILFSNQNFGNIVSLISSINIKGVKKILIDRNHLIELDHSYNFLHKLKNIFIKILMKFLYKKSDLVIGISKKLSQDLEKFCKIKVKTIYSPAYDRSIIKKAKDRVKLDKKFNYVINVSRFTKRKDHFTTIYGFKLTSDKINNLKLILIGYGPEIDNIKYLIKNLKLQKKVILLNEKTNPYPFIKKSDLLVLSSKYEGMGNVLVEAITLNTPVISSNCKAGPSEILLNGKGGDLFKVKDYRDLSKKMIDFFNNKKILRNKLKIARKNLNRFDLNKHINIYTNIFNRV